MFLQEVQSCLSKGAIEPVPASENLQGFYSTNFLVPKKTGDLRLKTYPESETFQQEGSNSDFQDGALV
jgi:hypothetical protein